MFLVFILFLLGLFLIIHGGDILVRSALALNRVTGINQVIIGATFVSVATTLPEVFVSIFAVAANNHGIAVGNAIGSMIANIALVLAISLAFLPQVIKRREVLGKSIFLLIATAVVFLFAVNLRVSWYEGVILLCAFAGFLLYNAKEAASPARTTPSSPAASPPLQGGELCTSAQGNNNPIVTSSKRSDNPPEKETNSPPWMGGGTKCAGVVWKIAGGFVFGQLLLIVGAFAIVENGEALAHFFNISETVVGFTVIAVGTSLPELTTAITSIKRKSGGLAIGNVIGANVINCTLLLGVCGIIGDIKGVALPVSRETVFVAIPVLLILTAIAVVPMLIRGKTSRWQGFALLAMYAAYVTYLVVVQPT